MSKKSKLILASASLARLAILKESGIVPDLVSPMDIDETPQKGELPKDLVRRLAKDKALAASAMHDGAYIIAADTVGAVGRRILGKTEDEAEARKTISQLMGRRHKVFTGVSVIAPDGKQRTKLCETVVKMKHLTRKEMDWYISLGEWQGKAGAYSIQGKGGVFVDWIQGSYASVVGIPVHEVRELLDSFGYPLFSAK